MPLRHDFHVVIAGAADVTLMSIFAAAAHFAPCCRPAFLLLRHIMLLHILIEIRHYLFFARLSMPLYTLYALLTLRRHAFRC